jgi:hypothetical protein
MLLRVALFFDVLILEGVGPKVIWIERHQMVDTAGFSFFPHRQISSNLTNSRETIKVF